MREGARTHARRKPDGGFCFIPAKAILRAWLAYRRGIIGLLEFRLWLACFEALARRCSLKAGRRPRYTLKELGTLVGTSSERQLRRSLRLLERTGLAWWRHEQLKVGEGTFALPDDGPEFLETLALVTNHGRRVPIPRRILRLMCGSHRPVLVATLLGHLLRCVYYRHGRCVPVGRCKAGWVAEVFGVDARNVKRARRELIAMGLFALSITSQESLNRWGLAVRLNIQWRPSRTQHGLPPRICRRDTGSPPLRMTGNSLTRAEYQEPEISRTAGSRKHTGPTLFHMTGRDLRTASCLDELWAQAQKFGLAGPSEAERLRVHACAARARRVGTRNPCGLFAWLLRQKGSVFLCSIDEDSARYGLQTGASRRVRESGSDHLSPAGPTAMSLVSALGTLPAVRSSWERVRRQPAGLRPPVGSRS